MAGALKYGDAAARAVSERFGGFVADTTALSALGTDVRVDGMCVVDQSTGIAWTYNASSTTPAGNASIAPDSGTGLWLAASPNVWVRRLTITSADLDAAATTDTVDIGAATPTGGYLLAATYNLTDAFDAGSGSATACTCQVGWSGSTDAVLAATDVFTGAATEGSGVTTCGTTAAACTGKTLQALFTVTGDNADTLTNGSITVSVVGVNP